MGKREKKGEERRKKERKERKRETRSPLIKISGYATELHIRR